MLRVPVAVVGGGPVGLVASLLLSQLGVRHCLLEPKTSATQHPQAHLLSGRSMELLQAHFPSLHAQLVADSAAPWQWRDHSYRYSVLGRELCAVDQLLPPQLGAGHWQRSPSNATHFPQSRLEELLRAHLSSEHCVQLFGRAVTGLAQQGGGVRLSLSCPEESCARRGSSRRLCGKCVALGGGSAAGLQECLADGVEADFVVAADGASSFVRAALGIAMDGEASLQTMLSVHFRCDVRLEELLPRPAMLYLTFNERQVAVFVAHDPVQGEWVAQLPLFPPCLTAEQLCGEALLSALRAGLGVGEGRAVRVLSARSWTLQAQVASRFACPEKCVFLVGDAAHRFPPAGGLGMNTGIADAHNLAWKLALVARGAAPRALLDSYEQERRPVAQRNTATSAASYRLTLRTAALLGADPRAAELLVAAAAPLPLRLAAPPVRAALALGLAPLAFLRSPNPLGDGRVRALRAAASQGRTLRLLFPENDMLFSYAARPSDPLDGARVPHVWLALPGLTLSAVSLPGLVCRRSLGRAVAVLIVPGAEEAIWTSALASLSGEERAMLCLVTVRESATAIAHSALQTSLQLPYFDPSEPASGVGATRSAAALSPALVSGDWALLHATDVTGEWGLLASNRSVLVRADGHVFKVLTDATSFRSVFDALLVARY